MVSTPKPLCTNFNFLVRRPVVISVATDGTLYVTIVSIVSYNNYGSFIISTMSHFM